MALRNIQEQPAAEQELVLNLCFILTEHRFIPCVCSRSLSESPILKQGGEYSIHGETAGINILKH